MANDLLKKKLFATTLLAGVAGGMWTGAAVAQDAPDEDDAVTVIEEVDEEDEARQERIVVTGSRLSRTEFTSASPLKVLNIEESVAAGLVDTASIVQRTSVAGGTQFDNTFTGQVTDSGPGSATVSLRGLDAERTLILSNGRRLAPAGVQGAPTRPDLNLIPLGMIERVDVLTDGASSIYGADAVAGVINFITRKDFDGLEIDAFYSSPEAGGGEERRISLATGIQSDRGWASFGVEYYSRDEVRRSERDYTPCERDVERFIGYDDDNDPSTPALGTDVGQREYCAGTGFGNMFLDLNFNLYGFDFDNSGSTPGSAEWFAFPPEAIRDANGTLTGLDTGYFRYRNDYNENRGNDQFALAQGIDRYSFFTNGGYNIDSFGNAEFYYEGLYANRSQSIFAGPQQIFPSIPCTNPYIAADEFLSAACVGAPDGAAVPGAPAVGNNLLWLPYVNNTSGPIGVDVSTARAVGGVRGDLEELLPSGKYTAGGDNFGINLSNWTYDVWGSFDHNVGTTRQDRLNSDRFAAVLLTTREENGEIVCGFDNRDSFLNLGISQDTCVPLDVTDPNIFRTGELPEDVFTYAGGQSISNTVIEQQMVQGTVAGDFLYLPAGTVPISFGFEFRKDSIESINDFLITSGANIGGDVEGNTIGSTSVLEAFGETEIPILKGQPFAEDLYVNLSARWTEEENYGALWTYRVQGVYAPTSWLTGRASFGTTYRSPNLREQFLAGQQSFTGAFTDPCVVSVYDAAFGGAEADQEAAARVARNCELQGADVTLTGDGAAVSIPVVTGGTTRLDAETSESLTTGITIDQPWFDSFDLQIALNYFSIEIENSIEEPSTGFILNECLIQSTELNSPFCNLIERNSSADPAFNFISLIDSSFVNVGLIETDGIDIDVRYEQEFVIGGNELVLTSNLSASNIMKNQRQLFGETESFDGRPYLPHWRGDIQTQVSYRDFTLNWNALYIGQTEDPSVTPTNGRASTLTDENGTPFLLQGYADVYTTDEWVQHDLSVGYDADTWSILVGVRNVLDNEPEIVDDIAPYFVSAGAVIGQGYDIYGRSVFARATKTF